MIEGADDRNLLVLQYQTSQECKAHHRSYKVNMSTCTAEFTFEDRTSSKHHYPERIKDSHNRDSIVVENCRDIFRWEFICRVTDEEASLSYSTIADDHTPA